MAHGRIQGMIYKGELAAILATSTKKETLCCMYSNGLVYTTINTQIKSSTNRKCLPVQATSAHTEKHINSHKR